MKEKKKNKFLSELRLNCNSGDRVIIATGRARRPNSFKKEKNGKKVFPKKECPFCEIEKQKDPIFFYNKREKILFRKGDEFPRKWTTAVFPNKYPALVPSKNLKKKKYNGFFETVNATGFHEVIITSDHDKSLALLPKWHIEEVIDVYSERYTNLIEKKTVNHVSIFHNHGSEAGASMHHPHSQLIGMPLIDTDLKDVLESARKFKKKKECIYCKINEWEMKKKTRIVYENDDFIAACPFVSKADFQVNIFPKQHLAFFEKITQKEKINLADVFKIVLTKLYKGLSNPPYNFYLNSTPSDGSDHSYYHWHWTILPRISIWGGFELAVGMEILTIEPEKAAAFLRKQKV